MGIIFLLLLIGVPLLEIAVFVEVGDHIGAAATIALVVLTAGVGIVLVRSQGLATLRRAQASLDQGRLPMTEVFHGLCLLFAGGLLLIPGFITDAAGLLLFVPAVRTALGRSLGRYMNASGRIRVDAGFAAPDRTTPQAGPVIDASYEDLSPGADQRPRPRLPPAGSERD